MEANPCQGRRILAEPKCCRKILSSQFLLQRKPQTIAGLQPWPLFLPGLSLAGSVLQLLSWHLKNDHPSSFFYDGVQREPGSPLLAFDVKDVSVILAQSSRERGSELVWEGQVY